MLGQEQRGRDRAGSPVRVSPAKRRLALKLAIGLAALAALAILAGTAALAVMAGSGQRKPPAGGAHHASTGGAAGQAGPVRVLAVTPARGTTRLCGGTSIQITRGTNPDGSQYTDPGSFVACFNGDDAVHYFPRGGYGYEQSLGCVERPYAQAEQAWPYLTYGSLVTVTG